MNSMRQFQLFFAITIAGFLYGCSEPENWNDIPDGVPPGMVRDVKVVNLNGGAQITYELPIDNDLLGVKAMYSLADGEEKKAFSSAHRDTILLQGYNSTDEYIIHLVAVDKSWNESEPVEVRIKPLTPPIALIRKSIRTSSTFGGVYAQWDNPLNQELAVSLYTLDSLGEYQLYDTYYTEQAAGQVSFRGLENTRQQFRIEFRDKWNNYSKPYDTVLTPLFEEEIVGRDQNGYIWSRWGWDNKTTAYRGDINVPDGLTGNQTFATLHDGNLFNNNRYWNPFPANRLGQYIDWPDPEHMVLPMYFIIDMGKQAAYSRLRIWMRNRAPLFSGPIMTRFEIWGTNSPKPLDEIGDGSKEANLRYWTDRKSVV